MNQPTLFDQPTQQQKLKATGKSAQNYHESRAPLVLEELRRGNSIEKKDWEDEYRPSRLAPTIGLLRNSFGFDIGGDGSFEKGYYLRDRFQKPKPSISEEMKKRYYESLHWSQAKARRLEFDDWKCVLCRNRSELQCHHICYNLFSENLSDLMTVCASCHELIHNSCFIKFPSGTDLETAMRLGWDGTFPDWVMP